MDGKEDQQHRTDGHHGYYYVGDVPTWDDNKVSKEPMLYLFLV
jgi:hypothetical protein